MNMRSPLLVMTLSGLCLLTPSPALPDFGEVVEGCEASATFLAGQEDEFLLPPDPTSRSAALDAAVIPPLGWKDFDDATINRFLGHTFRNLPTGIVKAELEIHMDFPNNNDTLSLGLNRPGSGSIFAYGIPIEDLPTDGSSIYLLDLSDLPDGFDLLPKVAADRFLDIVIQDDTTVDYFKLRVWTCTPYTYRAGRMDDFAQSSDQPSERAIRGNALDQAITPTLGWQEFDGATLDRFFGHTYRRLPANIVKAELEIRMRPLGLGSSNDTLNLGLNTDATFAFGTRIENLPEANGTWDSTINRPTIFTLDLGDLGIIEQVAADRFLDTLVQDDTAVDYLKLRVWTCPQRLIYSGWPYVFPGPAEPAVRAERTLEVFNPDPFEPMVVGVELDQVEGFCLGLEMLCPGRKGTALELAIESEPVDFESGDGGVTGVLSFEPTDPVQLSVQFDPALDIRVIIGDRSSGMSVGDFSGLTNGPVVEVPVDACFDEFDFLDNCYRLLLTKPVAITVLTATEPTVVGDEITICHDIVVGFPRVLSQFEFSATDLSSLTLTRSAVQAFGLLSSSLGNATFEPSTAGLTIANLDESGNDGLAVALPDTARVELALDPLDPMNVAREGSFLQFNVMGESDSTNILACELIVFRLEGDDGFEVDADFSALGASSNTVEVLRGGQTIATFPKVIGPAATVSDWPRTVAAESDGPGSFVAGFSGPIPVNVSGTEVLGDAVRISAEDPSRPIDSFSELSVRAAGIPEINFNGMEVSTCTPSDTALCLNDGRFKVESSWRTPMGAEGDGRATLLTDETGYFWFFNEDNVEVIVKVLDACQIADRFWVFAAGLTDVEVALTVTDTETGEVNTYFNPLGNAFQPIQDTDAFATCTAAGSESEVVFQTSEPTTLSAKTTDLPLNDSRFNVVASWRTPAGESGAGQVIPLTDDTGAFWFFSPDNVEVVIKVLDACEINDRFWVFAGGLTDVAVDLTVTDTQTGAVRTYSNPQGSAFQPVLDTAAFATCP